MSRLEQMRENFLQRIQREQNHQQLINNQQNLKVKLKPSKSIQNIPTYFKKAGQNYEDVCSSSYGSRKSLGCMQFNAFSCRLSGANCNSTVNYSRSQQSQLTRMNSVGNISNPPHYSQQQQTSNRMRYVNTQHEHERFFNNPNKLVDTYGVAQTADSNLRSVIHSDKDDSTQAKRVGKYNPNGVGPNAVKTSVTKSYSLDNKQTSKVNISNGEANKNGLPPKRIGLMARSDISDSQFKCQVCNRKFAAKERLEKHVSICEKTSAKQRPVFNSAKQRSCDTKERDKEDKGYNDDSKIIEILEEENTKPRWKKSSEQLLKVIREVKQKNSAYTETTNEIEFLIDIDSDSNFDPNLVECSYCKRRFGQNVILKHETICGKLFRKNSFGII